MRITGLIFFVSSFVSPVLGSAGLADGEYCNSCIRQVDSLFSGLHSPDSPGAALLIVKDGKVLLNKGYGLANLEHRIPVTPETVFDIASLSKQFTGFAISMLLEEGILSYGEDIRKYIPEMHDFGHTITIGHLLHHTSGIRNWTHSLQLAGVRGYDQISFERILNMAYHQEELNFIPGAQYSYSNTGYNLLAKLVERATGESFREWTEKNIFHPLGMKDTRFRDNNTELIPNRAGSYAPDSQGHFRSIPDNLTALGSSSLFTTTSDMAKWVKNMDNPQIGGGKIMKRMFRQGILNNGEQIAYAFGLLVQEYRGTGRISHNGAWASFRSHLSYFPEHHLSVVVLLNYPAGASDLAESVVDIFLGEELIPLENEPRHAVPILEQVSMPAGWLEEFTGSYRIEPGWYITVQPEGRQLMAKTTGEDIRPLVPFTDSTYRIDSYGTSILIKRDKSGRITCYGPKGKPCPKMKDEPLFTSMVPEEYTGEYMSTELKAIYNVSLREKRLVLENINHGSITLVHARGEEFRGGPSFIRSVEFYRDNNGKVRGFMVSSNTNLNQRFIKLKVPTAGLDLP